MEISSRRYKQLQPEDRVTMASVLQGKSSVRHIARVMGRAPSTISRELKRNIGAKGYASAPAEERCRVRREQARPALKLDVDGVLFGVVHEMLQWRWSPEQVAMTLARVFPKGHEHRVSTETIYSCIYAQPVGELRRELIDGLRHAHNKRVPRSKGKDRRGLIPDMVSIHARPPEVEDRMFPGHWEGDLIEGAGNASAVGTLVERSSRLSQRCPRDRSTGLHLFSTQGVAHLSHWPCSFSCSQTLISD